MEPPPNCPLAAVAEFDGGHGQQVEHGSPCQMQRSVKSLLTDGDFRRFKMGATAILYCKNLEILTMGTVKKVKLCHHTKFGPNRSNRYRDMAIFGFFEDVILDLRCMCSDHLRMEYGSLYHRAKFGWKVNMTFQWNSIFIEIYSLQIQYYQQTKILEK